MLAPADDAFLDGLRALLPPGTVREATDTHLSEPRGRYRGHGALVAPASAAEVAAQAAAAVQATTQWLAQHRFMTQEQLAGWSDLVRCFDSILT